MWIILLDSGDVQFKDIIMDMDLISNTIRSAFDWIGGIRLSSTPWRDLNDMGTLGRLSFQKTKLWGEEQLSGRFRSDEDFQLSVIILSFLTSEVSLVALLVDVSATICILSFKWSYYSWFLFFYLWVTLWWAGGANPLDSPLFLLMDNRFGYLGSFCNQATC